MSVYEQFGKQLVKPDGSKVDSSTLDDVPYVALYFSAKWCQPCKTFTPILAKLYEDANQESKQLEIIFVSGDNDEDDFEEYFGTMPWLAVEFDDILDEVSGKFAVPSIPTLVVLDKEGNVKVANAKEAVESKGIACLEEW
jgi:nucleoredoxin